MAIFTGIAAAVSTAFAGFFTAASLTTFALTTAASIGLSYIAKALSGNPNKASPNQNAVAGVQGTLQSGADVPRSFNLGYSVAAGSLVYANYWGEIFPGGNRTPNAFLTQVIALNDLPGADLAGVWVNGEKVSLEVVADANGRGYPVAEYRKDGQPYLWVKYYDGTQTTADSFLVGTVSSADRPYESTRVGVGVAYVIVTSAVNETLFSGFPTFKFELSGIPLYDPTKDSTNGGSGPQRWSDPATWGGDGDSFPVVQAYNILRGIHYDGVWLYGLQRMTAARLPTINWNAQIDKCRATVTEDDGPQPTYRTGGQVSVNTQPVEVLEALMSGCQGRVSEIGGFYKVHVGAPDSPTFSFTDEDILSTEEQHFAPFFGLADSINGVVATYPSPAEGWAMKPAPALYDEDFEAEDGDRRLLANPALDFVPYPEQVQRLQKSALQEARRARRHDLTLPPAFWIHEPGDVGEWTSARNGYEEKLFRIDGVTDKANLDVAMSFTEVDPSDYDWDTDTDFTPVGTGPTIIPRPAPQGVIDWFAEGYTLMVAGQPRRPAIRIAWDGDMMGVVGVQYEVRLDGETEVIARGRTDQLEAGSLIISQSLVADTDYEVRGQYLPSAPRDMLWSDWLAVTTPDVKFTLADFDQSVIDAVNNVEQFNGEAIEAALNLIASTVANQDARNWLDKKEVRSQLDATAGGAAAAIEEVRTVAVDTQAAFASFSIAATAQFGSTTAFVSQTATAIATSEGQAAAQYAVTLDVNGYVVGYNLINGGGGVSAFTVTVDKFQIAAPGEPGGAAVPIFTVANVDGSPKVGIRGDVIVDGSVKTQKLDVAELTAITAAFGNASVSGRLSSADGVSLVIDFTNNSISIPNGSITAAEIVNGAASNTQMFSTAGGSSVNIGTPIPMFSQAVNIQSGRATVRICASFSGSTIGASDTFVDVYMDAVLQKSFKWTFRFVSSGVYVLSDPFTVEWTITGVSAGNHTFYAQCRGVAGNIIDAGQVFISDFRR